MEEDTKEHTELNSFFELLRKTPIERIDCSKGRDTGKIIFVRTPYASLVVEYSNVRTEYKIRYKSVLIKEGEVEPEDYIHKQVVNITTELSSKVREEFLSKYKTK